LSTDTYFPIASLKIETALLSSPRAPLTIKLAAAVEKPAPGLPGKQAGSCQLLQNADGSQTVLVSLGEAKKVNTETFRQAGGSLVRWLKANNATEVGLAADEMETLGVTGALPALVEGLLLGDFTFDQYKKKEDPTPQVKLVLYTAQKPALEAVLHRLNDLCAAVNLSRHWAHEPANIINPLTLVERIQAMADVSGLKCTVIDDAALAEMGAGAIVAVGQGSKTPARLIVLEYPGKDAPADAKPVVLVGKALTFDSGGYSLKSPENIQGMKYDKCGGVTVAATLMAASALGLRTPLVGVIGATENMVSAQAYRPDDIIRTFSGKTVEIITTDAEGRLVLADALTYAQRHFQPRALIDLATLTGGVVVALGKVYAGLMTNSDSLSKALVTAGETVYERLWRLPLDDEYLKAIKGDDADLKNSGGRSAHPIMGGIFLKQFIENDTPWAHLDIAGTADSDKEMPYCPKGATGFGVRLLVEYLENLD
jgi:leucyl aminopeptidase